MKFLISIFITVFLIACSAPKKSQVYKPVFNDNLPVFDLQAHRGGRGNFPENTIPAMLNALGTSMTTLEMDVVITKDKKVILSHEPFFNHEISLTPAGDTIDVKKETNYNIYKMNYSDVIKYDVGKKLHPRFPTQQKMAATKPLLSDVFAAMQEAMMTRKRPLFFYNIETKTTPLTDGIFHPAPAEFVELLMKEIDKADMRERVIIQSFDFRTLKYLHQKYPDVKTAMLIEKTDNRSYRKQLDDLGFNPTIYSPEEGLVTPILIDAIHKRNIRIIPWTVNDASRFKELKKMGVDGIITDYPDKF